MKVVKTCPLCGHETRLEISSEVYIKYRNYLSGIGFIQDIPLPANERELLKTGMCQKCQDEFFVEPEEEEEVM